MAPARWAATSRRRYREHGATGWWSAAGTKDFTLRGLVAELGERGLKVDYRSVWEFVHAEKLSSQKKTLIAAEQDRADVARRRAQWVKYQGRIDPARLVFIDETWTKTNMAPLRGWAPMRPADQGQGAARPLEDHDLPGRAAP